MANRYSAINLHIIFATKQRISFLSTLVRPRMHAYIKKIIEENGHDVIAVGGVADHVHILIKYNINQLIPDLVKNIKAYSSKFYNKNKLGEGMAWQTGYAVISVSPQNVETVKNYICFQPEHHLKHTYEQELHRTMSYLGLNEEDIHRFYNA